MGHQEKAAIASLPHGGFVVVWQSFGQDGSQLGAAIAAIAIGFTSAVQAAPEFQVNAFTAGNQTKPVIASLANGKFVVVWQSDGQDGDGSGIFAQIVRRNRTPVGVEFRVTASADFSQVAPAVATLANGEFVVVWESSDGGIYGRRFNDKGRTLGKEFKVVAPDLFGPSNRRSPRSPTVAFSSCGRGSTRITSASLPSSSPRPQTTWVAGSG